MEFPEDAASGSATEGLHLADLDGKSTRKRDAGQKESLSSTKRWGR